jgi:hypothetical protein
MRVRQHQVRTLGHQNTTLLVSTSRALLDWPNSAWLKFPPLVCFFSVAKSKFTFELLQPSSCIIESSGRKSVALPESSEKVSNVRPPQRNIFVVLLGAVPPKVMTLHRTYFSLKRWSETVIRNSHQKQMAAQACFSACSDWKKVECLPIAHGSALRSDSEG